MTSGHPYLKDGLYAAVQSSHLQRRTALELRRAVESAQPVKVQRLINERSLVLEDGRRIHLRFLRRATTNRPSRRRIKVIEEAVIDISARLVALRGVGRGLQADLVYDIVRPEQLVKMGLSDHVTMASLAPMYVSLGMALVGLGLAKVQTDPPTTDPLAKGHFRLLSAVQTDAQTARLGVWGPVYPSAKQLRQLID